MDKKRVFGELELAILQVFKKEERLTVRDVLEILQGDDKYTTVMTVMNRLVEKKLLFRQRVGQQYEYWLNASSSPLPSNLLDKLKHKIFGGKSASMVSYLIESSTDITETELEEVETLIKKLKQTRGRS
jgi:predicted transcriptional regulator